MRSIPVRVFLSVAFVALCSTSCTSKKELDQLKKEKLQLTEDKKKLEETVAKTGSASNEMQDTLAEVEKSLAELRGKELKAIQSSIDIVQEGKGKASQRERLAQELTIIKKAVKENLAKLDKLEKEKNDAEARAKAQGQASGALIHHASVLTMLIDELQNSLQEKEKLIATLEEKVLNLTKTVEEQAGTIKEQEGQIKEKEGTIETQTKELNKGYVAFAKKQVLRDKGLIEKKGSVLGLGGGWLRTGKFDPELFHEIDITKESEFPIEVAAKKLKVLSDHPKESYEISESGPNASVLKVKDAAQFWRGSKYLIVMLPD